MSVFIPRPRFSLPHFTPHPPHSPHTQLCLFSCCLFTTDSFYLHFFKSFLLPFFSFQFLIKRAWWVDIDLIWSHPFLIHTYISMYQCIKWKTLGHTHITSFRHVIWTAQMTLGIYGKLEPVNTLTCSSLTTNPPYSPHP